MTSPATTGPRRRSGGRALPAVLAVAALSALAWTCAILYVLADWTTG
ncbi:MULTISPECIES: morphogenic membrane protein MmpA [unclassified Streptomyces]